MERSSKGRPSNLPKEVEEDLLAEVQRLRAENAYLRKFKLWFWKKSDTKVKNKGDLGTEARTRSGNSAGNHSTAEGDILLSSQKARIQGQVRNTGCIP